MSAVHEKVLKLAREVCLTADALMQPWALMGNRAGGKTYGGMKLFELAHALRVQCIAIDPIGKWWGLRLGEDGKSKGLDDVYIFGGKRADFPLQPEKGAFMAKMLVDRRVHAILDVSLMRKGDRKRFVADFAEEFYLLKKQEDAPEPCVLFIEEAHAFMPQKPQKGEERMLGAMEDIISEGRNAGIGAVILDQRCARVNKNCLAMVEILIALRTTYTLDRNTINDWIVQKVVSKSGEKVELPAELPFFTNGAGYLYAPSYGGGTFRKIQILPKKTFDSSATAKIGVSRGKVGKLTAVDSRKLNEAMVEVVKEAEANDPKALRRRIFELERGDGQKELRARIESLQYENESLKKSLKDSQKSVRSPVETTEQRKDREKWMKLLERAMGSAQESALSFNAAEKTAKTFILALDKAAAALPKPPAQGFAPYGLRGSVAPPKLEIEYHPHARQPLMVKVPSALQQVHAQMRDESAPPTGKLPPGEVAVLTATAQSNNGVTRDHLGVLIGYKKSSRNAYIARLAARGFVGEQGGRIFATETGIAELGPTYQPLPTGGALLAHYRGTLPPGEVAVLDALVNAYPEAVGREALDNLPYKKSSRNAYVARLAARQLLTEPTKGLIRASDLLFDRAA